jgi:branched-chain amino acid transport system substrate-binding protein
MADNTIASPGQFPWTDGSTPATAEFQATMKKFIGRAPGNGHALAWVAGKMLEKALKGAPDVTPESIMAGLWTFRAETLDGLSMPLTFNEGQNTARQVCWATNLTQGGKWVAFQGGRISCR